MGSDLTQKIALRLKKLIGGRQIVDLGERGGPSRSYIYRLLKGEQNVTVEELDAIVRAYGCPSLGEFFEPWRQDDRTTRQRLSAEARAILERIVNGEAELDGVLGVLRQLDPGEPRPSRKRGQ